MDGNRLAEQRQRSLAAAVQWSYQLLDDAERRVFRAVSVFPGPFTLDGAEAVAGPGAARAVPRLVDRSLLVPPRVGPDGRTRYAMLEMLRAYGAGLLAEAGEDGEATGPAQPPGTGAGHPGRAGPHRRADRGPAVHHRAHGQLAPGPGPGQDRLPAPRGPHPPGPGRRPGLTQPRAAVWVIPPLPRTGPARRGWRHDDIHSCCSWSSSAAFPSSGSTIPASAGLSAFEVYIPILIAFSIGVIALTYLPGPLVSCREQSILRRLSTTPVLASWVLAAQLVVQACLMLIAVVALVFVSVAFYGASAPKNPGGFVLALVLAIAALFGDISHFTPLGAAVQALQDSMSGQFPPVLPLLVMVAYALGFGYLAKRFFRWE